MTIRAAGATDVGAQRVVNEDRFHLDTGHGIFIVVDGVGGQAAGGRAADAALDVVRTRLTSRNGSAAGRVRDAITAANNEVHRQAASRAEWAGMACVLTAMVLDGDRAVIGHVGDTRLYKLRGGTIEKITPDHSPVGEREDAGEISELDAMRHPRRNEVYRDVGSDPHEIGDADFVDVRETAFESDAAMLLCSDGLSDLVPSTTIQRVAQESAGKPDAVARALIQAANDAGGKDNITVIYVEGDRFASSVTRPPTRSRTRVWLLTAALLAIAGLGLWWRTAGYPLPNAVSRALVPPPVTVIVVKAGESIGAVIHAAPAGTTILVEPGEDPERLTLKSDVRIMSAVSRAATLRLPASATDDDAAILASEVINAEVAGFRIVGDAATPLGTGVMARSSRVQLIDLEVTGAKRAAVDLSGGSGVTLLASHIHDNPGSGLTIRMGASPRIAHNTFGANGVSEQSAGAIVVEPGTAPTFDANTFRGVDPQTFTFLDATARDRLKTTNWFPDVKPPVRPLRGGR